MSHDQQNFIIENISMIDPRRTGAIPRRIEQANSYLPSNYKSTIEKINQGLRVCIILRGLPGSGKSSLAKQILEDTVKGDAKNHIISADNFFIRGEKYVYDPAKISEAHQYANTTFCQFASEGKSPLIVDNTHRQYWEMYHYLSVAIQYDYHIELMEPATPWKFNASKLSQKNTHGVPLNKIEKMRDDYESGASLEKILQPLNLFPVKEPKVRKFPPYQQDTTQTNSKQQDLIDFSSTLSSSSKQFEEPKMKKESLGWNEFEQTLQEMAKSNIFPWDQPKAIERNSDNDKFNPPPQVFEDDWDQPNKQEVSVIPEKKETAPQPQRKQKKGKKSSPPSSNLALIPHRKNCPNENESFIQLRELYPNCKDSYIWDLFHKCNGDADWCANILCDENLTDNMDSGNELECDCFTDEPASQSKKVKDSVVRKQTPIKNKKTKTSDLSKVEDLIKDNIKIGEEFYPKHVLEIKAWKRGPQQTAIQSSPEEEEEENTRNINSPTNSNDDEVLVALSIEEKLIFELDELFGGGIMRSDLSNGNNFPKQMFIKSSTARLLYSEVIEAFHSHREEVKFKAYEEDRQLAMLLNEQEKADKYPKLVQKSTNNFKDIMETQEALKNYEIDLGGWNKIEKPETIAQKLNKDKLYKVFPGIDKVEINNIFEAMERNFSETVKILKDSLGLTSDERKMLDEQLAQNTKFPEQTVEEEKQEEESSTDYDLIKHIEDVQAEIDHHLEEQRRCSEKSREHAAKKEFDTASYYASISKLHKQYGEEKRHEVLNLLAELLKRSSSTILDLHFFKQHEAKPYLHHFLDIHISRLRETKKSFVDLEVITGRGAHSANGVATLKNMTIKLFQERNLKYTTLENNKGLLKVKVHPQSLLYEEINKSNEK